MKGKFYYIFLLLICHYTAFSQAKIQGKINIIGHEQYRLYDQHLGVDHLDFNLIPEEIKTCFNLTDPVSVKEQYVVIDTVLKRRSIMIITKKAQNGYLKINENISSYINQKGFDRSELRIQYIINNVPVQYCDDIQKLIKLKIHQVKLVEYGDPDSSNNNYLSVKIGTK